MGANDVQLRRGTERVQVTTTSVNDLDPSAPKIIAARTWGTWRVLAKREATGAKAARATQRELVAELERDGFVVVKEEWSLPEVVTPEPSWRGIAIPRERAQKLADEAFSDIVSLDDFDEVDLHDGTLHVEGDLSVAGALFVRGDLVVRGDLTDEYGALLLVTGNVHCRSARLQGGGLCEGTVFADEYVYACSGNDYSWSMGRLVTKVFLEAGTATFVDQLDATVWRTMNAVTSMVDGQRVNHPKTAPDAMGEEALRSLRVSDEARAELRALVE